MIKFIDILGPKPKLFINRQESYKTVLGGTLTIIIGILTSFCFIAFGIDLFQRKRPQISSSKIINMSSKIERKDLNYILAPMLSGGDEIKDIDRKLNITFRFDDLDSTRKVNPTIFYNYQMVRCIDTELFKNNTNNITRGLIGPSKNFWCIPENFNRSLEGKFGNPQFGLYEFFIGPCKNSTLNNNNCLPEDQIKKELELFFVQFIYNDYYLDLSDYDLPFKQLWASEIIQCSSSSLRSDEIIHKVVNLKTDRGWILEDMSLYTTYQFDKKTDLVLSKLPNFYFMLKSNISNLNEEYTRKYIRLQEILANTGGFIKFIMIICLYINHFFSYNYMYEGFLIKKINKNNLFINNGIINKLDMITSCRKINFNRNNYICNENFSKKNIINYKKTSIMMIICSFRKKLNFPQMLLKAYKDLSMKKLNPDNFLKFFSRLEMTEKLIFDDEAYKFKKNLFYYELFINLTKKFKEKLNSDHINRFNSQMSNKRLNE